MAYSRYKNLPEGSRRSTTGATIGRRNYDQIRNDPVWIGAANQLGIDWEQRGTIGEFLEKYKTVSDYLKSGGGFGPNTTGQANSERGGYKYQNLGFEKDIKGDYKDIREAYQALGSEATGLTNQFNTESADLQNQINQGADNTSTTLPLGLFMPYGNYTAEQKQQYYNNPIYQEAATAAGITGAFDTAYEIQAAQDYLLRNQGYSAALPLARFQTGTNDINYKNQYFNNPLYQRYANELGITDFKAGTPGNVQKIRDVEEYMLSGGYFDPAVPQNPYLQSLESMFLQMEDQYKAALSGIQAQMTASQEAMQQNIQMQNNLAQAFIPNPELSAQSITIGDQRQPQRQRQSSNTLSRLTMSTGYDPMSAIAGLSIA
jgi:hypothetical protein